MIRQLWRDYSLSLTLAALFLVSWFIQTIAGWFEFASEQQQHNVAAQAFGPDGYMWPWLKSTMENWQSEFLQLFTFVVMTTFLIHRHSHESRDEQDQMHAQIELILAKLEEKK